MDVTTAAFSLQQVLDRPGTTCRAVIDHDWFCLRSEVSTTSHLILRWVFVLE